MADHADVRTKAATEQTLARLGAILSQLEELQPRLAASSSGEVEATLLERATELVEEASRLLEQLGGLAG